MFSNKRTNAILIIAVIAQLCVVSLSSCEEYNRNKSYAHVPISSIQKGKALSQKYCGSCHSLPIHHGWMPRLGIFNHGFEFYPSKRLLSQTEWQHIIDYYTATSPDSLPKRVVKSKTDLRLRRYISPEFVYLK